MASVGALRCTSLLVHFRGIAAEVEVARAEITAGAAGLGRLPESGRLWQAAAPRPEAGWTGVRRLWLGV